MKSFNIVVCASGGGGNFRSLIKYQCDYGYHISLLIVDRECPAIKIAKENGISYSVLEKKVLGKSFFEEFEKIVPIDTNLIVLATNIRLNSGLYRCRGVCKPKLNIYNKDYGS